MGKFYFAAFLFLNQFLFSQNPNPDFGEEFIQDFLPSVYVSMNEDDYNWMVHPDNIWSDEYQHATVIYKGSNGLQTDYTDLGIRLRGNTSRKNKKKSFKLNFSKFDKDQRFFGLKKLNLKANVNDPSCVREHLVMNLYRDFNLVVARVNQIKLYINNNYMGLYSNVEQVDKTFLGSRYNNKKGNLYKCTYPADLDDLNKVYDDSVYELKTNEDENNRDHLYAFIQFLRSATDSDFNLHIEEYIDTEEYVKQLAVEILTGHWDGYSYNKNNYYLYYNPDENRFEYIPYDTDNTLGIDWIGRDWAARNIYDWARHGEPRKLHTRILSVEKYKKQLTQNIDQLLDHEFTVTYQMDLAYSFKDLIRQSVIDDPYYPLDYNYSIESFDNSYTVNNVIGQAKYGIQPYIEKRGQTARDQLDESLLSVSDQDLISGYRIFPNPLKENRNLNIFFREETGDEVRFEVWNMTGQKVFSKDIRTDPGRSKISLDGLDSGIYIIKGRLSESNRFLKPVKIIVE
jgi:spore coat protein CotH